MTEAIIEKPKCSKCGADVRENTQFCYNCGETVSSPSKESESGKATVAADAPPDVEQAGVNDEPAADDKLARAAQERKKARVERRRPRDYTWEPIDDSSVMMPLLLSIAIAALVSVLVILGVWWK